MPRLAVIVAFCALLAGAAACSTPSSGAPPTQSAVTTEASRLFGQRVEETVVDTTTPHFQISLRLKSEPSVREVCDLLTTMHRQEPAVGVLAVVAVWPLKDGTGDRRFYDWTSGDASSDVDPAGGPHTLVIGEGRTGPGLSQGSIIAVLTGMTPEYVAEVASGTTRPPKVRYLHPPLE